MTIANDLRSLEPGNRVDLFILDLTPIDVGAGKLYFHPMNPGVGRDVVFQGQAYLALPVKIEGFEASTSGPVARPTLTVGNSTGALSDLVSQYNDLVNAYVWRKVTFEHYLDDGPLADALAELPSARYVVERKIIDIPGQMIQFELSSFDLDGVMIPRGVVQPGTCPWVYRGEDCAYAGASTDAGHKQPGDVGYVGPDVCTKTARACKARHGRAGNALRFGGFPGTLRMVRG